MYDRRKKFTQSNLGGGTYHNQEKDFKDQKRKTERLSNFELMRIISMFLIVLDHIIVHGRMLIHTTGAFQNILNLLSYLVRVHVNSFVLLSGYFQYKNNFSWKKAWNLFQLQWFYRIVITLLVVVFGLVSLTNFEFINHLLPFDLYCNYWFMNCYFVLYVISPLLNKFISNTNQKEHRYFILLLVFLFCLFPLMTNEAIISNNGCSIVQFVILYIIGAYLHKYPIKENYHLKFFSKRKKQFLFLFGTFFFLCTDFSFFLSCLHLKETIKNPFLLQFINGYCDNSRLYSNIFILLSSICYFLFFETLSIKSKFLNFIGKYVLSVYLISDHNLIRKILYKMVKIDLEQTLSYPYFLYMLVLALGIFTVCILIDIIRSTMIKILIHRKSSCWIKKKLREEET